MKKYVFSMLIFGLSASLASAATVAMVTVGAFGDQGWYADDTRLPNGTDLVGLNYTHAGKPGQTPTIADDAAIANQIQFVDNAPDNVRALKLVFGTGSGGKATLSTINTTTGFATGDWSNNFFVNLRRFRDTETNTTIKIGVQSTEWANSQNNFTPIRTGESAYDVTLVYAGNYTPFHEWEDVNLTATSGTWNIYLQAGNSYFTKPSANKTLAEWAADPTWGSRLFGDTAKVTSVLLGAGSFSVASTGYVDYIATSLLNNGNTIDFVPEPATIILLTLGGLLLRRKNRIS